MLVNVVGFLIWSTGQCFSAYHTALILSDAGQCCLGSWYDLLVNVFGYLICIGYQMDVGTLYFAFLFYLLLFHLVLDASGKLGYYLDFGIIMRFITSFYILSLYVTWGYLSMSGVGQPFSLDGQIGSQSSDVRMYWFMDCFLHII